MNGLNSLPRLCCHYLIPVFQSYQDFKVKQHYLFTLYLSWTHDKI